MGPQSRLQILQLPQRRLLILQLPQRSLLILQLPQLLVLLLLLLLRRTSAVHVTCQPASKEEMKAEPALPLCLFLLSSYPQSLPAFCSMFCMITVYWIKHKTSPFCYFVLLSNIETIQFSHLGNTHLIVINKCWLISRWNTL